MKVHMHRNDSSPLQFCSTHCVVLACNNVADLITSARNRQSIDTFVSR